MFLLARSISLVILSIIFALLQLLVLQATSEIVPLVSVLKFAHLANTPSVSLLQEDVFSVIMISFSLP